MGATRTDSLANNLKKKIIPVHIYGNANSLLLATAQRVEMEKHGFEKGMEQLIQVIAADLGIKTPSILHQEEIQREIDKKVQEELQKQSAQNKIKQEQEIERRAQAKAREIIRDQKRKHQSRGEILQKIAETFLQLAFSKVGIALLSFFPSYALFADIISWVQGHGLGNIPENASTEYELSVQFISYGAGIIWFLMITYFVAMLKHDSDHDAETIRNYVSLGVGIGFSLSIINLFDSNFIKFIGVSAGGAVIFTIIMFVIALFQGLHWLSPKSAKANSPRLARTWFLSLYVISIAVNVFNMYEYLI